ncbi:MAG: MFS transporter [Anaerolineae bacterium]|nr:MFS transporter [Anaerolineae bacterium]
MFLPGALYFTYFMALGSFMPFINLYYERMGLSGIQIGILAATPLLISSATVLLWGSLADVLHLHSRMLQMNLLLGAGAVFLLATGRSFQALLALVAVYAFFTAPIVPLLDSSALEASRDSGRSYGQLRAWGAVGWSISTIVIGLIIERFAIRYLFYGYVALIMVTFAFALFQPRRAEVLTSSLRQGLAKLLADQALLLFLLSVLLISLTLSAVNAFFSIYLDGIGAGEANIGLAWAVASLSEIPVMLYSGRLVRRIGSTGLIKISFVTFAIRWLLYSVIHTPALAIAVQALHGLSFATFLVGAVTFVNERAPSGLSTTAQSLFNLVAFGIGSIIGSVLGGYLYQSAGMFFLFRVLSAIAMAGFLLFVGGQRRSRAQPVPPSSAP